jgi:hypothetical protein
MTATACSPIAILCSGVALGVYNPALALRNRLKALGLRCEVYVLENLLSPARRDNIRRIKTAFHRNFSMALNSQKMTHDISEKFEQELVQACLDEWCTKRVQSFCVFSGFWLPLFSRYRTVVNFPLDVHLCLMDAVPSTSWKPFIAALNESGGSYRQHRLFDYESKSVACQLSVTSLAEDSSREKRFVVHGGGWGMGSYQRAVNELAANGLALDVICYEPEDVLDRPAGSRNFMIDPEWRPWEPIEGDYVFPPFAELQMGRKPTFVAPPDHPDVYDLVSRASAVISKPGGATLLDSFCAETPLVFLPETFGQHEQRNGELWQALGFGVDFREWRKAGFSLKLLQRLRGNISQYKARHSLPWLETEIARAA